MESIKREARLLVLLLVLLFIAFIWYIIAGAPTQTGSPAQTSSALKAPPPYTPAIAAQLAQSHGFQLFVSYTDRGFEPTSASIKTGDTVRFTNNSSHTLWIAAASLGESGLYPGKSDCGGTALDTCRALNPGEFWEFTFAQSGAWGVQNNLDKNDTATIRVE